jgi:hypothetical protein
MSLISVDLINTSDICGLQEEEQKIDTAMPSINTRYVLSSKTFATDTNNNL